jgi:hypothetical protein
MVHDGICTSGFTPGRVIVLDDEVERAKHVLEMQSGKRHGVDRRGVKRAIRADQKYSGFGE